MWQNFVTFYSYFVFVYSLLLIFMYCFLLVNAYLYANRYQNWTKSYLKNIVDKSPYTPGVSIVAPAYNEEVTIFDNVTSLMKMEYPKFEIVIVNDGSKDKTLQILIDSFDMVEVPYDYVYHVHCQPFKRLFKSKNPKFSKLVVVDKTNGGTKADAVNGGLNVAKYPLFINTDVDCILEHDAMYECVFPVLQYHNVIAVSGTMSMSNGMILNEDLEIVEYKADSNPIPLFQDLEYKRSFLVGKMGWSNINAMPNVSGGYGLFDTSVAIAAGGYGYDSFAEDMDMIARMVRYCCDFNRSYQVLQIPHNCCWTEGPSTLNILSRQRTRWGRGLIQLLHQHRRMICNPKYRRFGLITLPYIVLFEFLAPIIELIGIILLTVQLCNGAINWSSFFIMFAAIYAFSFMLSSFVVFYDFIQGCSYSRLQNYLKLLLAASLEPFVYHPFVTYSSLKGYVGYIFGTQAKWKSITRTGTKKTGGPGATPANGAPAGGTTPVAPATPANPA